VVDESLCQCPICLEVMFDKIFLCPEGHGICAQSCFTTLPGPKKCPQCRKAYGTEPGRGLMVEQIISVALWPCKYDCGFRGTGAEVKEHFEGCPDRAVSCLDCGEFVQPSKIHAHYKERGHILFSIKKWPGLNIWSGICTTWSIGDHLKYGSIDTPLSLEDADDFVFVRLWFSEDRLSAMVDVYHVSIARVCKFTCGNTPGKRVTFEVTSRPLCHSRDGRFKDEDSTHGVIFPLAFANKLADGTDVSCSFQLVDIS